MTWSGSLAVAFQGRKKLVRFFRCDLLLLQHPEDRHAFLVGDRLPNRLCGSPRRGIPAKQDARALMDPCFRAPDLLLCATRLLLGAARCLFHLAAQAVTHIERRGLAAVAHRNVRNVLHTRIAADHAIQLDLARKVQQDGIPADQSQLDIARQVLQARIASNGAR